MLKNLGSLPLLITDKKNSTAQTLERLLSFMGSADYLKQVHGHSKSKKHE
jgi:hypothetical protein